MSYLVLSGQIQAFSGFGFEATLASVGDIGSTEFLYSRQRVYEAVDADSASPDTAIAGCTLGEPYSTVIVPADGLEAMPEPELSRTILATGCVVYYSLLAGSFEALVVTGDDGAPIGVFEDEAFLDLLAIDFDALSPEFGWGARSDIGDRVMGTGLASIMRAPRARPANAGNAAVIADDRSIVESLRRMYEADFDVLAVEGPGGRFIGIIVRSDIAERIPLTLLDRLGGGPDGS